MKKLVIISSMFITLVLTGCAGKTGHTFLEDMSESEISKSLIVHQTTKEQVKQKFGDPEEIDFDPNNQEKWIYKFKRSEAKGVNFVPIVSMFYQGTNDTTKHLRILFDKSGTLLKYAFSNRQGETKMGAFQ